jgi:hypothetical protein
LRRIPWYKPIETGLGRHGDGDITSRLQVGSGLFKDAYRIWNVFQDLEQSNKIEPLRANIGWQFR